VLAQLNFDVVLRGDFLLLSSLAFALSHFHTQGLSSVGVVLVLKVVEAGDASSTLLLPLEPTV
jgi:cytochrome c oxidase subunit IV